MLEMLAAAEAEEVVVCLAETGRGYLHEKAMACPCVR